MYSYIIKRVLISIILVLFTNLITFLLFFAVNSPDDMARSHLGSKYITEDDLERWKTSHGYDKPLLYNENENGLNAFTETLWAKKSFSLMKFDFGTSDEGRDITYDIKQRMWPSFALAFPTLLIGLMVEITFALIMVFFRGSYIEPLSAILCIVLMSISTLFYIIMGQFLVGKMMHLVPMSGYLGGLDSIRFLILPIAVGVIAGIGGGARWYRILFLEEINKDYVRTARAKGLSEIRILFSHVLKNGMLPILTAVVVILPSLFLGSLIMESFFGIPGLGSYTIDAIQNQDFAIVRTMVFLGSVLYIVGLLLTDISYTLVDPRVRLK